MNQNEMKKIIEVSILVAIACVFAIISANFFVVWWHGGGAISISPLILVIISLRHGIKYGAISVVVFAIVYAATAPGASNHLFMPWTLILDYILGHLAFGFAGLVKDVILKVKYKTLVLILFAASMIRLPFHVISGVITFNATWGFSLWYNASHVYFSFIVSAIVGVALLGSLKNIYYPENSTENE